MKNHGKRLRRLVIIVSSSTKGANSVSFALSVFKKSWFYKIKKGRYSMRIPSF